MKRDKFISFRVSEDEYRQLMEDKPKNMSLSKYIRISVLYGDVIY